MVARSRHASNSGAPGQRRANATAGRKRNSQSYSSPSTGTHRARASGQPHHRPSHRPRSPPPSYLHHAGGEGKGECEGGYDRDEHLFRNDPSGPPASYATVLLQSAMDFFLGRAEECGGTFVSHSTHGDAGAEQGQLDQMERLGDPRKVRRLQRVFSSGARLQNLLDNVRDTSGKRRPKDRLNLLFKAYCRRAPERYGMRKAGTWPWSPRVFVGVPCYSLVWGVKVGARGR